MMKAFNVQAGKSSHEPKVNVLDFVRTLKAIDRIVVNTALYRLFLKESVLSSNKTMNNIYDVLTTILFYIYCRFN